MSDDTGKKGFNKYKSKADKYINDKDKAKDLLSKGMKKANENKGPISQIWDELQLLFALVNDWINGSYKEIPMKSLMMIIVGIVYFVSPVDLVPDFIPIAGLTDDAAVIGYVIKQIQSDLNAYRMWKGK